ncbi:MAG: phosphoglycerate mutase family protein [Patescibacteria group bacterium]|nr:phosphoglycerate mutase family protein [Patescibacteria group bacterium]MDD5164258.1 phosphoglycerate mutase family protein [Patescibacteria group bacterium]MDD5535062.1 phosphoglycerate mutase family protein [Patescibacteria group bacterium]
MSEENILKQKWPNRLVIVRHGLSVYNEERELINRGVLKTYTNKVKSVRNADVHLSKIGKKQAFKTGLGLKKDYKSFDLIFASPFKRAQDTAKIIARNFSKTRFVIEERVREKEFGIADGLTAEEIKKIFPYEYERKEKEKKYYYRPIGGESYPDVNLRVWSFLTSIVREYSGKDIMVVCHSAVMLSFRKLMEKFTEAELLKIDREDDIKNCAIIAYQFNPNLKPKPKMALKVYNKIYW